MSMKKRTNKKQTSGTNDSWLLPYADMLTLLLALFIVLFAMSQLDAQKFEKLSNIFKSEFSSSYISVIESSEEDNGEKMTEHSQQKSSMEYEDVKQDEIKGSVIVEQQLSDIQEKIDNYIAENDLTVALGTELTNEGLLITLSADFSFTTGSAFVNEGGRKIAYEISELLYIDSLHEVVISGHADDRPVYNDEFKSNWELSVMRAVNFMVILLEKGRLNQERFSAKGYGEHQPLVPNTSQKNRAKNRRVEVLIRPLMVTD